MPKFKIHLIGAPTPMTIEAKFESPEALYASAAETGFVVGSSRKSTSNSVVSQAAVLVAFSAIAMVEAES